MTLIALKSLITFVPTSRMPVEVPLLGNGLLFDDSTHFPRYWPLVMSFNDVFLFAKLYFRGRGMTYSPVVFVLHVVSISVVAEMVEWIHAVAFHC